MILSISWSALGIIMKNYKFYVSKIGVVHTYFVKSKTSTEQTNKIKLSKNQIETVSGKHKLFETMTDAVKSLSKKIIQECYYFVDTETKAVHYVKKDGSFNSLFPCMFDKKNALFFKEVDEDGTSSDMVMFVDEIEKTNCGVFLLFKDYEKFSYLNDSINEEEEEEENCC